MTKVHFSPRTERKGKSWPKSRARGIDKGTREHRSSWLPATHDPFLPVPGHHDGCHLGMPYPYISRGPSPPNHIRSVSYQRSYNPQYIRGAWALFSFLCRSQIFPLVSMGKSTRKDCTGLTMEYSSWIFSEKKIRHFRQDGNRTRVLTDQGTASNPIRPRGQGRKGLWKRHKRAGEGEKAAI